tara:strand:- start:1878 stop:2087 length:210 start_codon:yes stop_codon:yes gene_type:complete
MTDEQHNRNWREAMIFVAHEWLNAAESFELDRYHEERVAVAEYLKGAPSCAECGAATALTPLEGGCSHA